MRVVGHEGTRALGVRVHQGIWVLGFWVWALGWLWGIGFPYYPPLMPNSGYLRGEPRGGGGVVLGRNLNPKP